VAPGQVFYAALLMRGVLGSQFPYSSDAASTGSPAPLNRSFFDVGATQGAAYDLDVTTRATVLGGSHPVVTFAQSPGNLALRVVATPEPGVLALLGLGGIAVLRRRR
jgi:MYXO-CTERM domain-containing protein